MEAWMLDDLKKQAEAFRRAPHEDHNRHPVRTTMRDIRGRRARRRANLWVRMLVARLDYNPPARPARTAAS